MRTLCVLPFAFLLLHLRFSLPLTFDCFLKCIYQCEPLSIHANWISSTLDVYLLFFTKFWRFLAFISSNNLCFLFTLLLVVLPQCVSCSIWWCLTGPLGSVHFSWTLLIFFCSSDLMIPIFLFSSLLTLPSACSNMTLNSSSEFFISVTVLFNSRISFGHLFKFSLYWHFHFVHTLFLWFCPQLSLVFWVFLQQLF